MYYAQINPQRVVTAVSETAGAIDAPHMILIDSLDADLLGKIHNTNTGKFESAPAAAQPTVPQQITRAQGKAALITMGAWDGVTAYVAAIADPTERALAEVALNDTLTWQRSSPFLNTAAAALGLTPAQIDALFVAAAAIEL